MATATTTNINIVPAMASKYFIQFDLNNDVVINPSKVYIENIIPNNTTMSLAPTTKPGMYSASYDNQTILTMYTASKTNDPFYYGSIRSLLKRNIGDTWIPVSSSQYHVQANNIEVISFSNNLIGDRLSIFSTQQDRFAFKVIDNLATNSYVVYPANNFANITYDINYSYLSQTTNFGLVFDSSVTTPQNEFNKLRGLFFGELGLVMLYNSTPYNPISKFVSVNVVRQYKVHSKTYFCRITHQKFNASTNPTWVVWDEDLKANVPRVSTSGDTYTTITTIGLYGEDNTLLAIAKFSQPILKYLDTELHAKIVLQY